MAARKNVTQEDIARAAGVSTASVSRVLNRSPLVTPQVRERVEAAIAALHYFPNQGARALAMRRTRTLGAIIPTLSNAIFAQGVNAFENAARERGYALILSLSNYDLDRERLLVRNMIEKGVDGLLLVGNDHRPDSFETLRATGLLHVCAWAHRDDAPAANVGFSNADAVAEVVDHLVGLGHREIAMLAGITTDNDRARERVRGVRNRLAHHGLRLDAGRLLEIPYSIREARRVFPAILRSRPTAVICGNDVIAFGALFAAREAGVSVPGDVSIAGFDNLALSDELMPAITTVDVPTDAMGQGSADALIDALETDAPVQGRRLATRLLVRGSTGPSR